MVMFTDWWRLPDNGYAASTSGLRPSACVAWVRRTRPGKMRGWERRSSVLPLGKGLPV